MPSRRNVRRGRATIAAAAIPVSTRPSAPSQTSEWCAATITGVPASRSAEQEERELEEVAAEDVADRELDVAEADGGDAAADLGQRARRRQERGAEECALRSGSGCRACRRPGVAPGASSFQAGCRRTRLTIHAPPIQKT